MTPDDHGRRDLYARLAEVIGDEQAETLMAHLPSHPAAEQATKSDVRELGRRMDRLEGRMDAFFAELREQGRSFQAELRAQGRTFTLAVIGSVLTAAALAFGAAAVI